MDGNERSIGESSETKRSSLPRVIWDPTPPVIVKKMLELAQVRPEDIVYDLGCGDARILLTAVKEFGAKKAVGYEINKDIYEKTKQEIQKQRLQDTISIIRVDLLNADISKASVITLFLSMEANEYLRPKLEKEAEPGTRIVSYVHTMRKWQEENIESDSLNRLYLYVVPKTFSHLM